MATILGRLITSRWAVRHPLTPASVSSFGWSAVSPPRPEDRQRAARSGGQDWPQATVRREAVLTAASTARASIRSEALSTSCCSTPIYGTSTEQRAPRGYRPRGIALENPLIFDVVLARFGRDRF